MWELDLQLWVELSVVSALWAHVSTQFPKNFQTLEHLSRVLKDFRAASLWWWLWVCSCVPMCENWYMWKRGTTNVSCHRPTWLPSTENVGKMLKLSQPSTRAWHRLLSTELLLSVNPYSRCSICPNPDFHMNPSQDYDLRTWIRILVQSRSPAQSGCKRTPTHTRLATMYIADNPFLTELLNLMENGKHH